MMSRWERFDDFYDEVMPQLYRAMLMVTADRELAADATSEAFTRAFPRWQDLHDPKGRAWRVAYNHVVRWWQRIGNHEVLESSLAEGALEMTAEAIAAAAPAATEAEPGLLSAVADLPPQQRAVIAGRYFLDLRPGAVANALGIDRRTESEHHRRAMEALRKRLADWEVGGC